MKILYEDNHLLCVEKPANIPVMADQSHDMDLLSMGKEYIREKYSKPGNVYLGLVHRLDRPVGGTMVFAKTSKAASRLSDSLRKGDFVKTYYAVLDGVPENSEGELIDYLSKDRNTNTTTVTTADKGKKSVLEYHVLAVSDNHCLVSITLKSGRSHQIRVQFSSRGLPLVNDQRYNPNAKKGQIALWAVKLSFPHPVRDEPVTIISLPPRQKPWSEFEVKV